MQMQQQWIDRANQVLPAGTLGNFDADIILARGLGANVWDEDNKKYVDYLIGSGPMLIGHGHPEVLDEVNSQLGKGMTFFANNTASIELAEEICRAVKCAQQVRFVSTGSEADMYAMRVARAATGREKILKFEGGYHGMSAEAQMSLAPQQLANFPQPVPDSAGIPQAVQDNILIAPFNDIDSVIAILDEFKEEVAGVIVEPLQRVIPPTPGFLEELRQQCSNRDIVLIFDEIVTGFRLAYGGAQERYGVVPDLCTLGKVIGGGFPLAAIAGRADLMAHFNQQQAGDRFLMQIGTLSGNPIASVAGLKTMEILRRESTYTKLYQIGESIMALLHAHLSASGHKYQIVGDATLFDVVFSDITVVDYRTSQRADKQKNAVFNRVLREHGILKSPTKLYPSLALTEDDLQVTQLAIEHAVAAISS